MPKTRIICSECRRKRCIAAKKVCEKVEKLMRKEGIRNIMYLRPRLPRSVRNWLIKQGEPTNLYWREVPFSSLEYVKGLQ